MIIHDITWYNLKHDFLNIQGFFFPDVVLLLETLYLDSLVWNRNGHVYIYNCNISSEYLGLKCHLHNFYIPHLRLHVRFGAFWSCLPRESPKNIFCNCRRRMKICPGWWSSEITRNSDPCRFYWPLPRFTCRDASQQCENTRRKVMFWPQEDGSLFTKKKSLTGQKKTSKYRLRFRMVEIDVHVLFVDSIAASKSIPSMKAKETSMTFRGKPTA